MTQNDLIKQAIIASLCEHPQAEELQKKAFKGDHLNAMQNAMLSGGVKITKEDLFTKNDEGDTLIATKGFWKNFDQIVEILKQNGESFVSQDFLLPISYNEDTLLKIAEKEKALPKLFDASVWNDVGDMEQLWFMVTPYQRKNFNNANGILDVKRAIMARDGLKPREDQLAEMGINYLDVVSAFQERGRFDILLQQLKKADEKLTKADMFLADEDGDTMFYHRDAWESLERMSDILAEQGDMLEIDDFLFSYGHKTNLLELAENSEGLPHVFNPKLWVGRPEKMAELWGHVRPVPQAQLKEYTFDQRMAEVEDMTYGSVIQIDEGLTKGTLTQPLNGHQAEYPVLPLGLKSVWQNIDEVRDILTGRDEKITLSDLRHNTGFCGSNCLMVGAKVGCFDKILDIVKTSGEKWDIADFVSKDKQGTMLLDVLARQEEVHKVFSADIWVGRIEEMQELWQMLPFEAKAQVDFEDALNKVTVATVNQKTSAKVRRRPKGPKG